MKLSRVLFAVGFCLCFVQCKRTVDNALASDTVIVKIDELENQLPPEAFTDVELIHLQTTTQSLVGQIKQRVQVRKSVFIRRELKA